MELSRQERLKNLRAERGLTLEQLAEKTYLPGLRWVVMNRTSLKASAINYALIKLAKSYGVTADYLLGLSETQNHPNADLADLRLSDDIILLLKSGLIDNSPLCELVTHPNFLRLMADLEIYVNVIATKQVQGANAIFSDFSNQHKKPSVLFSLMFFTVTWIPKPNFRLLFSLTVSVFFLPLFSAQECVLLQGKSAASQQPR